MRFSCNPMLSLRLTAGLLALLGVYDVWNTLAAGERIATSDMVVSLSITLFYGVIASAAPKLLPRYRVHLLAIIGVIWAYSVGFVAWFSFPFITPGAVAAVLIVSLVQYALYWQVNAASGVRGYRYDTKTSLMYWLIAFGVLAFFAALIWYVTSTLWF